MRARFHIPVNPWLVVFNILVLSLAQTLSAQTNGWTDLTTEEVFKAAQAGRAEAEYFYWTREMNQAGAAADRVEREMGVPRAHPTAAEIASLRTKWDGVSENDVREAANSGNYGAQVFLCNQAAAAVAKRGQAVFEWAKRAADQEFPAAEYDVACAYLLKLRWNILTPQQYNPEEGIKYLERAATHGSPFAQYLLGTLYLGGRCVPTDFPKAIHYLQLAADQDGPRSEYRLAQLYANGYGEPRSAGDSPLGLLRKSAQRGFRPASYDLAERYRLGRGVPMDYVQSIRLYQAAGSPPNPNGDEAAPNAGEIFKLVDQHLEPKAALPNDFRNFARALSVYLKATQSNDVAAMAEIGQWYDQGHFEPRDLTEAEHWSGLAASRKGPLKGDSSSVAKASVLPKVAPANSILGGTGVDARNERGWTPLQIAARAGDLAKVRELIGKGADVNAKSLAVTGGNVLSFATEGHNLEVIKELLAHGADINEMGNNGATALYFAAGSKKIPEVEFLLSAGADIETDGHTDERGFHYTPLMAAACNGDAGMVELLISHGAKIERTNNNGDTVLMVASKYNFPEIIQLLLARGARASATGPNGHTALIYAAYQGRLEIIKLLLAAGADPNAIARDADRPGNPAYDSVTLARQQNHPEAMELLRDAQAKASSLQPLGNAVD